MKSTVRLVSLLAPFVLLHCTTTTVETRSVPVETDAGPSAVDDGGSADAGPDESEPPVADDAYYAAMSRPRALFPSLVGKDGRIRVMGGMSDLGVSSATEVYDPTANTWTAGPSSSMRRYGHAGTTTADGDMFVVGGTADGSNPTASAALLSIATNTWADVPNMPTARLGLGAATGADGRIYAVGGRSRTGLVDVVEVYSPDTKTWATAPSMPTKRLSLLAVAGGDGKIYAIGGRDAENKPLAVVEAFDPATETWTTVQPLGTARFWFGAALGTDQRIYVVGGIGSGGEFLDSVEAFTPGSGWTTLAPMPEGRGWVSAAAGTDGRVFAIGGAVLPDGPVTDQPPPLSTMFGYDPKTNAWTR
ncbi:MAG: hypothetical protein KF764_30845 [Labilithrix sp.]|nr:hypothetical protein [Labilithrix sp.]